MENEYKSREKTGETMRIGLTGGIGSGKTTVSSYLKEKGFPVINADEIAREITLPGSPILQELSTAFGGDIIREDGSLNRKLLGERAFQSKEKRELLNQITHGEICRRILKNMDANREPLIFVDVPLLFETGLDKSVDQVWLVAADTEIRVMRVAGRDGVSPDHVRGRIRHQMDEEEKRARAHVIIENMGTKEELYQEVDRLLNRWQRS